MAMCAKGAEWKLKWMREEEAQARMVEASQAYGRPLDMVTGFKYFGKVLNASDNDRLEVVANLRKA